MAAQLDYSYTTPKGVAGGKYDIAFDEVITRKTRKRMVSSNMVWRQ